MLHVRYGGWQVNIPVCSPMPAGRLSACSDDQFMYSYLSGFGLSPITASLHWHMHDRY